MSTLKDYSHASSEDASCSKLYACGYNGFRQISAKELDIISAPEEFYTTTNPTKDDRIVVKVESCLSSSFILWGDGTVSTKGWIPGTSGPGNQDDLLPGQAIKNITCADDNIMFVNKEGKLFSWNDSMQKDSSAVHVEASQRISQICCGDLQCVAITSDGSVSKVKQENNEPHLKISKVVFSHQVQSVSCGKEHVLLLTMDGKVFSFGGGSRGQLGRDSLENHREPMLVEALDGISITQISCGGWHSAVRSSCGDVYCWGWNKDGQVGISDAAVQVQAIPYPVTFDNNEDIIVIELSCGARHTVAVTSCGDVWTWGWGFYGQLGHESRDSFPQPTKIPSISSASRVWCSHWNTFLLVKQVKTGN